MNIIVFGSTGTVGKVIVLQALEAGHNVTAFCRNADKISDIKHSNLSIAIGDVFNIKSVKDSLKNMDAVCIALGSGKSRKNVVRSGGTRNIIEAMQFHNIKRLTCQSTLGAGDSNGNLNFFWRRIMFGWYLKDIFLDHELQEKLVMGSGLDWTIIRAAAFTNGNKTNRFKHGFGSSEPGLKLKISRADVAAFTLAQLQSDKYLHKTPGLSY